jgi:hypothetical protein
VPLEDAILAATPGELFFQSVHAELYTQQSLHLSNRKAYLTVKHIAVMGCQQHAAESLPYPI